MLSISGTGINGQGHVVTSLAWAFNKGNRSCGACLGDVWYRQWEKIRGCIWTHHAACPVFGCCGTLVLESLPIVVMLCHFVT